MLLELSLALLCVVAALAVLFAPKRPPGTKGPFIFPVVGNMPQLFAGRHDVMGYFHGLQKEYGDLVFIKNSNRNILLCFDPVVMRQFFVTDADKFVRKPPPMFMRLFGTGIFTSNGADWKQQRATARPMFTKTNISEMTSTFTRNANTVVDILNKVKPGEAIDLQDLFFRYTLDSIGEIGFGVSLNSLNSECGFARAFDRSQAFADGSNRNPFLRWFRSEGFEADVKYMEEFVQKIVDVRREADDYHGRSDLLSRFMCLRDSDDKPYSDEFLRDTILNFFIAGRDTTAVLLSWTFYLLSQNPRVEKKLRAEIEETFGGEEPDYERLRAARYLRNTLKETLRLYPSVPADGRSVTEDLVLEGHNVVLPKGTVMVYSQYVMGRDPKNFDEPMEYRPERFEKQLKQPWAYVPFHGGAQICLGQHMAQLEAAAMTAKLLQKFRFTLVEGQKIRGVKSIVYPIQNGLNVHVHKL
eukprot:TRINITY_DN2036_c0_g1_i1.p1 TRINITY_DN2036_c0_g1~~TRINITY_DN2036_c0_g1_i1.p1  ORF type:complete len:469 (+),score=81.14 TRINITY_DN2036_c0_g1_i1:198-1604(+)